MSEPKARINTIDRWKRTHAPHLALGARRPKCGICGGTYRYIPGVIYVHQPRLLGVIRSPRPDAHLGGVRA